MLKRIISTFLLVLMLASSMTLVISAQTEGEDVSDALVYEYNTTKNSPTMNYWTAETKDGDPIKTQADKLEVMDLRLEQNGFRMYVDEYSGEIAIENVTTGDVMFSNPYDVADSADADKKQYLSQIIIDYKDLSDNSADKVYYSYDHCVRAAVSKNEKPEKLVKNAASQVTVKAIKNGLRVEYAVGRIETRYLVPERITEKQFMEEIYNVAVEAGCTDREAGMLNNFFLRRSLEDHLKGFKKEETIEKRKKEFLEKYPMAEEEPIMVFTGITSREYKSAESLIKKYCPDFTYANLDEIYLDFDYTPEDQTEALFNISIEYTINEDGFSARIPANGIRFDESLYLLTNIQILPFMGAAKNPNKGYTFFPDGAGALFDFEQLAAKGGESHFYGSCYGADFAYYELGSGAPHNEVIRYPVFGLKEDMVDEEGNEHSRGFLAIVEEGDALMNFDSSHNPEYNSIRMRVNPRPYDTYDMSDAISVSDNTMWTVVSPRKYTGNFVIRYIMLTDPDVAKGKGYYDPSYVGMAAAYRDYLVNKGVLTKLTGEKIKEDVPVYIETFGAIETTEKFLSIPYETMKPLASFADITRMYDELATNGIGNVNFILTGYGKGGLNVDQMPYNLNWENAVEKEMKFDELLDYAKEKDFGIYPDFDFVFASDNKMFDGLSLRKHAIEAIDGRYTSKREYSATRQSYVSYFELAISPAYFKHFYDKLNKDYLKYDPIGISVSTLGSYLNSDFDDKDPYNREDAKEFTVQAFADFDTNYNKVLTSGGNAYTWKYVDYITDIATDSSRHANAAATVPFLGMVLHGYVQYAGEAINMEGNIDYAMLRAIENGASLKFILSYQNTEKLKEYQNTSKYYSVRYDIWLDELVSRYNDINDALGDVQLNTIAHHQFLDGVRIPNEEEVDSDSANAILDAINKEIAGAASDKETFRNTIQTIRNNFYDCRDNMAAVVDGSDPNNSKSVKVAFAATEEAKNSLDSALETVDKKAQDIKDLEAEYEANDQYKDNPEKLEKHEKYMADAETAYNSAVDQLVAAYKDYLTNTDAAIAVGQRYVDKYEMARDNFSLLDPNNVYLADVIPELAKIRDDLVPTYYSLKTAIKIMHAQVEANVSTIEERFKAEIEASQEAIVEEEVADTAEYNKYAVAKNSIVYEIYDNGKAFVLNFNNYAVKVKLGNVYYTIGAYDYITLG